MATVTEKENKQGEKSWQVRFSNKKLLGKPVYITYYNEKEAWASAREADDCFARGIVPEWLKDTIGIDIEEAVDDYVAKTPVNKDDVSKLYTFLDDYPTLQLKDINFPFAERFITELKRKRHIKPGTIRKYKGAVSRFVDWAVRHEHMESNPFDHLPKGYATYTDADLEYVQELKDEERDRRLEVYEIIDEKGKTRTIDEEVLIRKALAEKNDFDREKIRQRKEKAGWTKKQIDDHIQALDWEARSLCLMFELALESAMRMAEIYSLSHSQVDLEKRTIFLDETKNGDKRQVPITSIALIALKDFGIRRSGPVFPWGPRDKKTGDKLSKRYNRLFKKAGLENFRFHDLRHEATSRFFIDTDLSTALIMKITGHKTPQMLARYANIRGSELVDELW